MPEVIKLLAEVAGEDVVVTYQESLRVHYWLWKWLRKSDARSLGDLRRTLYKYGLVEPSPDAAWIVNRGLSDYSRALGDFTGDVDRLVMKVVDGSRSPEDPISSLDSGSGNCTAIYEAARPWVRYIGSGLSLNFSLDGTIRNFLREELRSENLLGYKSGLLEMTLLRAEIFSVAALVVGSNAVDKFDPFNELVAAANAGGGTVEGAALKSILAATGSAIERVRSRIEGGSQLVAAMALGFLVDALAGRVVVPNGVQFAYDLPSLAPEIFGAIDHVIEGLDSTTKARNKLLAAHSELVRLSQLAELHRTEPSRSPESDDIKTLLQNLGDCIKEVGFELRSRGEREELTESLHAFGNNLWRWYFFIVDYSHWAARPSARRSAYDSREVVRSWLERPFGVIGLEDLKITLGCSPFAAGLPKLAAPIVPLLRRGVEEFVGQNFPGQGDFEGRLEEFIARRCRLRDLRDSITVVHYPHDDQAQLADLLVELVTIWFYQLPSGRKQQMLSDSLRYFERELIQGNWLLEMEAADGAPMLSRRQIRLLDRYRGNPTQVTGELFEFSGDVDLPGRIDVYPPEQFMTLAL